MSRTLTPLDPAGNEYAITLLRGGGTRREQWGARSADGVWIYDRVECPGTPWDVIHVPTGRRHEGYPTLREARFCTDCGWTLQQLDAGDERTRYPSAPQPNGAAR